MQWIQNLGGAYHPIKTTCQKPKSKKTSHSHREGREREREGERGREKESRRHEDKGHGHRKNTRRTKHADTQATMLTQAKGPCWPTSGTRAGEGGKEDERKGHGEETRQAPRAKQTSRQRARHHTHPQTPPHTHAHTRAHEHPRDERTGRPPRRPGENTRTTHTRTRKHTRDEQTSRSPSGPGKKTKTKHRGTDNRKERRNNKGKSTHHAYPYSKQTLKRHRYPIFEHSLLGPL